MAPTLRPPVVPGGTHATTPGGTRWHPRYDPRWYPAPAPVVAQGRLARPEGPRSQRPATEQQLPGAHPGQSGRLGGHSARPARAKQHSPGRRSPRRWEPPPRGHSAHPATTRIGQVRSSSDRQASQYHSEPDTGILTAATPGASSSARRSDASPVVTGRTHSHRAVDRS